MTLKTLPIYCALVLFFYPVLRAKPSGRASDAEEMSAASNSKKIVSREDVVYGRVHGAELLADVAYSE